MSIKHKAREIVAVWYSNYFMTTSSKITAVLAMIGTLATFIAVYFGKEYVIPLVIVGFLIIFVIYTAIGRFLYSPKGIRQYETKKYWESDFGIKPNVEQYEMQLQIAQMLNKIAEHLGMSERIEPSEEWKNIYTWLKYINKTNKFDNLVDDDLKKWGLRK